MRNKATTQILNNCKNYPLSTRIYSLRKSRGLSQKDLAGYLKVSLRSISNWESEKGQHIPCVGYLEQLSDYFNIPFGVLIGPDEEFSLFFARLSNPTVPVAETFTVTLNRSDAAFWELYRTLPPACRHLIQNMIQLLHKDKDSIEENLRM